MTVKIKNMELPKSCSRCPLMSWDEDFGTAYCYLTYHNVDLNNDAEWDQISNGRYYDCPIEEIEEEEE